MSNTYLPGNTSDRILDLMSERQMNQTELARIIGCSGSMLSRFLNQQTSKISTDFISRLAHVFDVSTDFLLGNTDIPRVSECSLQELGLSQQAAVNLKGNKVNARVISFLLENQAFASATYKIARAADWRAATPSKTRGRRPGDGVRHITGMHGGTPFDPDHVLDIQDALMKAVREIWPQMEFSYFADDLANDSRIKHMPCDIPGGDSGDRSNR